MLTFIFGKPATGKSYTILQKLKKATANGETTVLIVPEQFTFESERAVLHTVGDRAAINVSVLSFSRLFDELGRFVGGTAGITLADADKVILMKRALNEVADKLCLWKAYVGSVSFAKSMLDTIGEFKINAISPVELLRAAEDTESNRLKNKLNDLALIYEAYDLLLGESFIDPADRLSKVYDTLCRFDYFKGKTVFIDSFKGFTGQQYKILERVIATARNVYISFTNDIQNNNEFSVFTNIRNICDRIKKIANSYNVPILEPVVLDKPYNQAVDITALGELLSSGDTNIKVAENITVVRSASIFDEAEYCARTIRRLVRTKNLRYRDFVIIARDADRYTEAVTLCCNKNGIPLFYDKRLELSAFPLSVAVNSAINALNFSTEKLLRFHKTGLGTLNNEEISLLENYCYVWNIEGEIWLREWDMDPRGFTTEDDADGNIKEELAKLNILRERAITPISNFKNNFKFTAKQMATAVIKLLDGCNSSEKLSLMCDRLKALNLGITEDVLRQAYDEYIKILDSIVRCFGERSITREDFSESLELAVLLSSVGVIPQMLDEVAFGSADRIRPSRPKIAFILGANQGVFPKPTHNAGVFNLPERKILIDYGLEIADNSIYSAIDEDFLVYCNLCCPTEKIYISYATQSVSGEALEPAAFVKSILQNFECATDFSPAESLSETNIPETLDTCFSEYCRRIGNAEDIATLASFINNSKLKAVMESSNSILSNEPFTISKEAAYRLYGKDIYMSATKFDTLNRCKFSFFAKYGLRVKRLQPAEFDVMQRGTVVHFVLEKLIGEWSDKMDTLTVTDLDRLTEEYIALYLNMVIGYRSIENARLKFLVSRLTRSLKEVVRHIAAELSQSKFKPVACELGIGKGKEIELNFPYSDGKIHINGSIDRVDEYNGFVRIIDYKTGSKSFKLPDIVFGLNLQMLIYLYAVIRGRGLDDNATAAILYQPSSRDINSAGLAMNGLLKLDNDLISAMDCTGDGIYVPKLKFTKSGSLDKRCTSFIEQEGFTAIFDYIEKLMARAGDIVSSGDIAVNPIDGRESGACKYCDFACVCRIEGNPIPKVPDLTNDEVFEILRGSEENGV